MLEGFSSAASEGASQLECGGGRACGTSRAPSTARLRGEGAAAQEWADGGFGRLCGLQRPRRRGPRSRLGKADPLRAPKRGRAFPVPAGRLVRLPRRRSGCTSPFWRMQQCEEALPWLLAARAGRGRGAQSAKQPGKPRFGGGGRRPRSLGEPGGAAQGGGGCAGRSGETWARVLFLANAASFVCSRRRPAIAGLRALPNRVAEPPAGLHGAGGARPGA